MDEIKENVVEKVSPEIKITQSFARDSEEILVPIEKMKVLNEEGKFVDQKPNQTPNISLYWKNQEKKLALLLLVSSLIVFMIMLASGEKYTAQLFEWFTSLFSFLPKIPFIGGN